MLDVTYCECIVYSDKNTHYFFSSYNASLGRAKVLTCSCFSSREEQACRKIL